MTNLFKEYSQYYDLIYGDKDTLSEVEYIVELLGRYGVSAGRLLEFGSGTGRHARLLSARGYVVHGIECFKCAHPRRGAHLKRAILHS